MAQRVILEAAFWDLSGLPPDSAFKHVFRKAAQELIERVDARDAGLL